MIVLDLFINKKCNLRCDYCTVDLNSNQNYNISKIKNINFNKYDLINVLGGEPTMHSNFNEIIKNIYIKNQNIIIFTNGLLYNKLKVVDDLNINKFFITFHYDQRYSFEYYINLYNKYCKFNNKIHFNIILHKNNFKLSQFFNNYFNDKKENFYVLNNIFEDLNFKKIIDYRKKYKNLNFSKIMNLFNKNIKFIKESYYWDGDKIKFEKNKKNICTIEDNFKESK